MTEGLKYLLTHIAHFDQEELNKAVSCFKPRIVKKGTLLLRAGETCKEFYYLHKGCIRIYYITRQGDEKTRYIMTDCSIGTALSSFISQKPSFETVDALEDSELLAISYKDFRRLNEEMYQWAMFYQRMLEMAYTFQTRKIESRVTLNARQRYQQLLQENPLFPQRLTNKILASYLDIRQETLSRLKSK